MYFRQPGSVIIHVRYYYYFLCINFAASKIDVTWLWWVVWGSSVERRPMTLAVDTAALYNATEYNAMQLTIYIIDLCPNNVWLWLRTISPVADCSIASVLLLLWCISLVLICFGAATGCLNYKCWQSGCSCCSWKPWKPCLSVIKAPCCRRLVSRQRRIINSWTGMRYTLTALSVQTRTLVWRHRIQCFLKKKTSFASDDGINTTPDVW